MDMNSNSAQFAAMLFTACPPTAYIRVKMEVSHLWLTWGRPHLQLVECHKMSPCFMLERQVGQCYRITFMAATLYVCS